MMDFPAMARTRWLVALLLLAAVRPALCQEAAPDDGLPDPAYFFAEPAPNDNARRVGLRWPRAETEVDTFVYVVFTSRGPDGPWAECARTRPESASFVGPAVSGFYPYHFSQGREHCLVVEPVIHTPAYWPGAEKRYAGWVQTANGNLLDCGQMIVNLQREVRAQRGFLERYRRHAPQWQQGLAAAMERYAEQFGVDAPPGQLDLKQELARLDEVKRTLAEGEVEERFRALRPASQYAGYLEQSAGREQAFRDKIGKYRGSFLDSAGQFFAIVTAFRAETRMQLADLLGIAPDSITAHTLASRLPELKSMREQAARRASSPEATVADQDAYDRLNYAHKIARHFVDLSLKPISMADIETDLLWQLGGALKGAVLDEEELPEELPDPDTDALVAALAQYRDAGLALGEGAGAEAWAQAWSDWTKARRGLTEAKDAVTAAQSAWVKAKVVRMKAALREGGLHKPGKPFLAREITRLTVLATATDKWLKKAEGEQAKRRYYFRLGVAPVGGQVLSPVPHVESAAPQPGLFDMSKLANFVFAAFFTAAVLAMIYYVRRKPNVFLRRIAGLEAVEEAIGRATEMGRPALFVHGLTGVSDIAVLASLSILSRLARKVADYDSDLLVANNDPIVYAISHQVIQEGYAEAGREDAFKPENNFIAASQQFPYVAAVAGIMKRRRPAANFFMGYFYAESLILAEVGASTGAIQIAATDSFSQLPFFITTCDYTLMGEELYAAGAYLSRDLRMLATIKAQDVGKSVLLIALPLGTMLSNVGLNWLSVIFTAFEKGF